MDCIQPNAFLYRKTELTKLVLQLVRVRFLVKAPDNQPDMGRLLISKGAMKLEATGLKENIYGPIVIVRHTADAKRVSPMKRHRHVHREANSEPEASGQINDVPGAIDEQWRRAAPSGRIIQQ